ncbi:MAG: DUF192 domain-containing protein [Candidatus Pacebacteria bacterium]|nr:DUF192 domain-containing protein [Candidatus Paceibacterota bacterium]
MSQMSIWSIYVLIFLLVIMGGAFVYFSNEKNELLAEQKQEEAKEELEEIIEAGKPVLTPASTTSESVKNNDDWRVIYPKTQDLKIAKITVQASVAKTWAERIKGLSNTPYLPEEVVKLFVFDSLGEHSIWMKDMNYAIDIIWVDAENKIVDIKENATPESFPEAFSPKKDALYVIETKVGFVAKNNIKIGDEVLVPKE